MGFLPAGTRRITRHREYMESPHKTLESHAHDTQAKPAHYVVIHDEMKLKVDELEKITHNLSYLYERATKAVSYCPPAYYADRLCERGRCYLLKYVSIRNRPPGTKFDPNAEDVPWKRDVHKRSVILQTILPVAWHYCVHSSLQSSSLENSMFYI